MTHTPDYLWARETAAEWIKEVVTQIGNDRTEQMCLGIIDAAGDFIFLIGGIGFGAEIVIDNTKPNQDGGIAA